MAHDVRNVFVRDVRSLRDGAVWDIKAWWHDGPYNSLRESGGQVPVDKYPTVALATEAFFEWRSSAREARDRLVAFECKLLVSESSS